MARAWSEVAASPEYMKLPPDQQDAARGQYFEQVVAPKVPQDKLEQVRQQFDASTQAAPNKPVEAAPAAAAPVTAPAPEQSQFEKTLAMARERRQETNQAASALPTIAAQSFVGAGQAIEQAMKPVEEYVSSKFPGAAGRTAGREARVAHGAEIANYMQARKERLTEGMGEAAKFGTEMVGNPLTYVGGLGGKAAAGGVAAAKGILPKAAQWGKDTLNSIGRMGKQGAVYSGANALITPSGDPKQEIGDRLSKVAVSGAEGFGVGAGMAAGGKLAGATATGVFRLANKLSGGVLRTATNAAKGKIAQTIGTPASPEAKAFMDMGIKLEKGDTPDKLYEKIFTAKDAADKAILLAIAPKAVGPVSEGGKNIVSIGEGFYNSRNAASAKKAAAWDTAKTLADSIKITKYPKGADNFAKGLTNLRDRLSEEVDPRMGNPLSGVLADVNRVITKLGADPLAAGRAVKINMGDVMLVDKFLNEKNMDSASSGAKEAFRRLAEATRALKDEASTTNKQFGAAHLALREAHNSYDNAFGTKIMKKLGVDDDFFQHMGNYEKGFPLNSDAEQALIHVAQNIDDVAQLHNLKIALKEAPRTFDAVVRAKMASLLGDSSIDPAEFAAARPMMKEIISLSGAPDKIVKQQLTKLEEFNKTLSEYGISKEFTKGGTEGMSPEKINKLKKAAAGVATKHYMFGVAQLKDALFPPLPAQQRRLVSLGKTAKAGEPASRVMQDLTNKTPPLLRKIPAAAIGQYMGREDK